MGGTFARCCGCKRIVIFGQVCICGSSAMRQASPEGTRKALIRERNAKIGTS